MSDTKPAPKPRPKSKKDYTEADLGRQALAAAELIKSLNEMGEGEDQELKHDTIEGETDFFEMIAKVLDQITECEIVAEGCAVKVAKIIKRKSAAENRMEYLKGLIDQAWQMAELEKHIFPVATVSGKTIPPKLIVEDEAKIPAKYWVKKDPTLDRKKLFDDIKAGTAVPGATKSNGGKTIQVRWA